MKKLLRTIQINFPYLANAKLALMRFCYNKLGIAYENDFCALSLFPDVDGALFLDVGANRGHSTDAILRYTKNSCICQFEPNPLLVEQLSREYVNNKRIMLNIFGLGDENGEYLLYIPCYKNWMFDGLASFSQENANNWLKDGILFYEDQYLLTRKFKCKIKRLDDINLAPFFIKLDIQGYELQALIGGESTIKKYKPILLIETPNEITINHLKRFGYQLYSFEKGKFKSGIKGKLNTFFMTPDKAFLVEENIIS
ncbi:FkbM family methyltransferase [Anabaena sp. WFMT]|uniref:FkbM family methyltransferase n=1 Tax=Anabaena sp. WFMT TaxID=3449730 RepID=UPI003F270969